MPHSTRTHPWVAMFALACFAPIDAALCQPALDEPPSSPIAQRQSRFYDFTEFTLHSADRARHYSVQIAKPKRLAPVAGYASVYLLDGNEAVAKLNETLLEELNAADPPMIVSIGYADTVRFNVQARAYDYTPPLPAGKPLFDDANRPGGGADRFLDLIEEQIKPRVEELTTVDPHRRILWGHSYGGLLTLYAAFTRPNSFQRFVAASPSLWWNYGAILEHESAFVTSERRQAMRLDLMVGELEQQPRSGVSAMRTSLPPGSTRNLADRLKSAGVNVTFTEFPGLGHGPMFEASLTRTLRDAASL